MRKVLAGLLLLVLLAASGVTGGVVRGEGFSDTAGHWAAAAIERAVQLGYVSGFPDGTFQPDAAVTRAQAIKMALLAAGQTPQPGARSFYGFPDVTAQHWLFQQGYIQGDLVLKLEEAWDLTTDRGNLHPDRPATRGEVAALAAWLMQQATAGPVPSGDDSVELVSVFPPPGTVLRPGTSVVFEAAMRYKLSSAAIGEVTFTLRAPG